MNRTSIVTIISSLAILLFGGCQTGSSFGEKAIPMAFQAAELLLDVFSEEDPGDPFGFAREERQRKAKLQYEYSEQNDPLALPPN